MFGNKFHFTLISKILAIALFLLAGFLPFISQADAATGINRTINFQGKVVTSATGTNVTTGSHDFTFKLYDAASSGTLIWTENFNAANGNALTVTNGLFTVALGSVCAFSGGSCQGNTNTAVDFNTDNLYLDITFDTDHLTTRVRLAAVPYAINAEKVSGLTVTSTTGTLTIQNGKTISFGDAFTTSANPLTLTTGGSTNVTLPTTGTLATLAGTENLSNKSFTSTVTFSGVTTDITTGNNEHLVLSPNGTGNVGIKNTNPLATLDITGTASLSGNFTIGNGSQIQPAYGPLTLAYKSAANTWAAGLTIQDTTGNVGIGTTAPAQKLDIAGSINLTGAITNAASYNGLVVTANTGSVTTGTWRGSPVASQYGGTGQDFSGSTGLPTLNSGSWSMNPITNNGVAYGNGTTAMSFTSQGAANSILTANAGAPIFSASPTIGTSVTTPLVIGGTGTTSTLSLRSTSGTGATGADIIFQTGTNGGTEAMRILNNGNVGIGVTNPSQLFAVGASSALTINSSGNLSTTGTIATTGSGTITSAALLTASSGLTLSAGALNLTATSGSEAITGYGTSSKTSTTATGNINTLADSSFAVAGGATGNLVNLTFTNASTNTTGTSVVSGLNIAGTNTSSGTSGTMETYGIRLQNLAGTAVNGTQNNYGVRIGNQGQSGAETSYGLYVDAQSGSTTANYAAIFAGGNVGIGTTTPSELLELSNNGDVYASIHATTGTGQIAGIRLERGTFGGGGDSLTDWQVYDSSTGIFTIDALNNNINQQTRLAINDQSGNLGIGTTAFTNKLDVAGSVNISTGSTFKINNSDVLSATTLTGVTTASSLVSVGAITTGTWNATTIAVNHGGTGVTTSTGSTNVVLSNGPTISSPVITNISPGGDFTLTQNSVVPFTSVNAGAVVNTLYLKAGNVGIGNITPSALLHVFGSAVAPSLSAHNAVVETATSTTVALQQGFYASGSFAAWFQAARTTVDGTNWPIVFNPLGGNVGIGTAAPGAKFDVNATCTTFQTTHQCTDYAEIYPASEDVAMGEIVSSDHANSTNVRRSSTPYAQDILGIVSTNPAVVVEGDHVTLMEGADYHHNPRKPAIALSGRVPTKVSTENGPIANGDPLTSSSVAGVAMKATKAGRVVGIALDNYTNSSAVGSIMVFVNPSWYDPDVYITSTGDVSVVAAQQGANQLYALQKAAGGTVDRNAEFNQAAIADLKAGNIDAQSITIGGKSLSQFIKDTAGTTAGSSQQVTFTPGADLIISFDKDHKIIMKGSDTSESAVTIDSKGNATFAGTVTAKKIKADQIEGLDVLVGNLNFFRTSTGSATETIIASDSATTIANSSRIASLETALASLSGLMTDVLSASTSSSFASQNTGSLLTMNDFSTSGLATVSGDFRVKGDSLFEGMLSVIDQLTTKNLLVTGVTDFLDKVLFHKDVQFAGRATFNNDTAGFAIVKKRADTVVVTFDKEYEATPLVNVSEISQAITQDSLKGFVDQAICDKTDSLSDCQEKVDQKTLSAQTNAVVTRISTKGFTIRISQKVDQDLTFSWTALAITNAKTFSSNNAGLSVTTENKDATSSLIESVLSTSDSATPTPIGSGKAQ